MKIQHMQYALEIARCGSINKAAEKLMLSQPNISSAVKTLESELGYSVFSRTNKGISVTPEGQRFLAGARKIVEEYEQIATVKSHWTTHRFSLSAGYHSAIEEAFSRLCAEFQGGDRLDFSIVNVDPETIIENVYLNKSDLGVLLLPQNTPGTLLAECSRRDLEITVIRELQFYICLSRNHPLLAERELDLGKLRDYPFVDYGVRVLSGSANLALLGIINPDKRILVGERDTRCHIVSISNAFSLGCGLHPRIRDRYNWVTIPLPDVVSQMVAVHRRGVPTSPETKRYLQLLQHEVAQVK